MLVLLGWSVVAAVREKLGIEAPEVEAPPRPVIPPHAPPRRDPAWMGIN
jgi:hypothetical protein